MSLNINTQNTPELYLYAKKIFHNRRTQIRHYNV